MFSHRFFTPAFAEVLLRVSQYEPGNHAGEYAGAVDVQEQLGIRNEVVQNNAEEQAGQGDHDAVLRYAVRGQFAEEFRSLAVFSQGVQHTAGAVNTAVAAGQCSRQYDEVDDAGGGGNAYFSEGRYEGAAEHAQFIPRIQGDDDEDSADVEDKNTPNDVFRSFAQRFFRVLRFPGRYPDEFDALEGCRDDAHCADHAAEAVGEKAAVRPEVGETEGYAVVAEAEQDNHRADDEHDDDSRNFDNSKPEFEFTVVFNGSHVGQGYDEHAA